jgi:hypothetical protein
LEDVEDWLSEREKKLGKKIIEKRKEKKTLKKKYGRQIKRETLEDVCLHVYIYINFFFQSLCYMLEGEKRIHAVQNESWCILLFQKMLGKFERLKNNNYERRNLTQIIISFRQNTIIQ